MVGRGSSAPDHQRLSKVGQTLYAISSNVRLSVFSGDRRYLEASERLRLTQRLPESASGGGADDLRSVRSGSSTDRSHVLDQVGEHERGRQDGWLPAPAQAADGDLEGFATGHFLARSRGEPCAAGAPTVTVAPHCREPVLRQVEERRVAPGAGFQAPVDCSTPSPAPETGATGT